MSRSTGACRQGRHDICPGRGYDHGLGESFDCACACHRKLASGQWEMPCNCGSSPPGNDPTKEDYEPSGHWPSCPAWTPGDEQKRIRDHLISGSVPHVQAAAKRHGVTVMPWGMARDIAAAVINRLAGMKRVLESFDSMERYGKARDRADVPPDPLAGLTDTGRRVVEDFIRQSRELAAAHERLDIYAVPPGPIVERLEWWFEQDSETLDQLIQAKESGGSAPPGPLGEHPCRKCRTLIADPLNLLDGYCKLCFVWLHPSKSEQEAALGAALDKLIGDEG